MNISPTKSIGLAEELTARLLAEGLVTLGQITTLLDQYPEAVPAIAGISAGELRKLVENKVGPLRPIRAGELQNIPQRPVGGLVGVDDDATGRELQAEPLGYPRRDQIEQLMERIGPLPLQVDLSPGMPPPGDQGQYGFCGGFAASAPHESQTGRPWSYGYNYRGAARLYGRPEVEGTPLIYNMRHLYRTGHVDENLYSYQDAILDHPIDPVAPAARAARSLGFASLTPANGDDLRHAPFFIKAAVAGRLHPELGGIAVPFGMQLFESFRSATTSREGLVSVPLPSERSLGGHAMAVVGYMDATAPDNPFGITLMIVRNSWSTRWAEQSPLGLAGHALIPEVMFTRSDLLWEAYLCLAPKRLRAA